MSGRLGCLGGDLNLFRVWSENNQVAAPCEVEAPLAFANTVRTREAPRTAAEGGPITLGPCSPFCYSP